MIITIVQTNIVWENIQKNLSIYQEKLNGIKSDIIILPEMFNTGFTMDPSQIAEDMNGPTILWLKQNSKTLNAVICGSLIIRENNSFFNRFVWVEPNGSVKIYDKRHLFSFAGENKNYTPGNSKLVIEYNGWKICPLICYDLRFPVWSRNVEDVDLIIYVANWPSKRKFAWKSLLVARAIENQCYVIGVNRVGSDPNNTYSGESCLINALGETIYINSDVEDVYTNKLEKKELEKIRNQFPFLNDKDNFYFTT